MVDGGEHTWIQSPLITESEAHEFMMEARKRQGWETVTPSVTPGVTSRGESVSDLERDVTLPGQRDTPRLTLVKGEGGVPAIPPMPDKPPAVPTYSLAAAAREEIVPMTADALRQAKRRPGFPDADENGKYTAQQLTEWYEGKRGEKAASE